MEPGEQNDEVQRLVRRPKNFLKKADCNQGPAGCDGLPMRLLSSTFQSTLSDGGDAMINTPAMALSWERG